MKTICTLKGKIIMSQDGDALVAMEANASQYSGAIASVVSDEEYTRLTLPEPPTYQELRQKEYPSLLELTVALYDTDDKSAVEAKRASVKAKYPKP